MELERDAIVAAVVADIAATADVEATEIVVTSIERVTWRDGSLGCPEPGMLYTQALVDGFRILVEAAGRSYDYRVGRGGRFRRCESGASGGGVASVE